MLRVSAGATNPCLGGWLVRTKKKGRDRTRSHRRSLACKNFSEKCVTFRYLELRVYIVGLHTSGGTTSAALLLRAESTGTVKKITSVPHVG